MTLDSSTFGADRAPAPVSASCSANPPRDVSKRLSAATSIHRVPQYPVHSPLVQVDIGLLADQVRVPTTDTLDLGQGVHDLAATVNVGVEETQNVLFNVGMPIGEAGEDRESDSMHVDGSEVNQ